MDVTKIQKLNQMAVSLEKHHIVADRDDAVNNAARIYGTENNFSRPDPVYDTQQTDLVKEVRKLTFALQHLTNHYSELKIAHEKLQKDFNDFIVGQRRWEAPRQQPVSQNAFVEAPRIGQPLSQQNMQQQSFAQQAASQGMSEAQARLLAAMEPAKTRSTRDPTKAIDRNNVAPSEVSIDKFFYSGRK